MTNPLGIETDVYVPAEDGTFVSETHARIAEIINDYDETMSLAWIPPNRRVPGDPPFAVVHRPLGGAEYVVCYAEQCDERLLARIFSMDNAKTDVWSQLEASQAAAEAIRLKRQLEENEEADEIRKAIVTSPKSVYRHKGVKYQ